MPSLPQDGRTRVRDAVQRLVRDRSAWPAPTWTIFRNRLLDECGGDQRALIGLVVRAGELGIPEQLGTTPMDAAAWRTARGPQVLALVGDSFLQPEAAQWAVDVWGVALGVVTVAAVSTSAPSSSRTAAPPPTAASTPSWSSPAPRRSAPPPRAAPPPSAAWTAPRSVPHQPPPAVKWLTNVSLLVIALGVLWVIVGAVQRALDPDATSALTVQTAAPSAPTTGSPAGVAPQRVAASPERSPSGVDPRSIAGALPAGGSVGVQPPQRAGVPNALVTRVPPAALQAVQPGVDQLTLKDGRALIGRVDIIRASDIVFREASTGLRYEFPRTDVAYIITEFGSVVRFEAEVAAPPAVRAMVARGVGGRYRVRFTRTDVQGSAVCASLWQDTPPDDAVTVEHQAGQDTLMFRFDNGTAFRGVVDRDGLFNTVFAIVPDQAFASTAVTTRLSGRFVAGGFDAQMHVIGYRRVRGGNDVSCYSVLDAVAR